MKCPGCGREMVCEVARIRYTPVYGKGRATAARRSKMKRTFVCKACGKRYAYLMVLKEVEEWPGSKG